jgi:Dihydrodipicolinate reductase
MAKIAIIGYGKMGKEIEQILLATPHTISAIIDNQADWESQHQVFLQSDVAIEFSTPTTAYLNCLQCIQNNIPVITGTTGWDKELEKLLSENSTASFIYGSNYSIGANLFFKINKELALLMNQQSQYEVSINETHHTAKKDIPSGTAVSLAKIILSNLERKNSWVSEQEEEGALSIYSHRIENVPGIHQIDYKSEEDTISILHTAHGRKGFASGAVKAALWLLQHPGVHHFQEIFHLI